MQINPHKITVFYIYYIIISEIKQYLGFLNRDGNIFIVHPIRYSSFLRSYTYVYMYVFLVFELKNKNSPPGCELKRFCSRSPTLYIQVVLTLNETGGGGSKCPAGCG